MWISCALLLFPSPAVPAVCLSRLLSPAPEPQQAEASAVRATQGLPDLRQRMADPVWFSRPPSTPWWSLDGRALYFERPTAGRGTAELFELNLSTGQERVLGAAERHLAPPRRVTWNANRTLAVSTRGGDLYLWNAVARTERQLTRTSANESRPRFTADGEGLLFQVGGARRVLRLRDGFVDELPNLDLDKTEAPDEPEGFLEESQARLMKVLTERRERDDARAAERELWAASDPERVAPVLHLGDSLEVDGLERVGLSDAPTLEYSLLRAAKSSDSSKRDEMPAYVTESSYVESSAVRPHVGVSDRRAERLFLVHWATREARELDLGVLPLIADDPLEELREAAAERKQAEKAEKAKSEDAETSAGGSEGEEPEASDAEDGDKDEDEPEPRGVAVSSTRWSPNGESALLTIRSLDNKDRWLALVAGPEAELEPVHHLRDTAWIGWGFNEVEWLSDGSGFWFLSEESGWSQLYVHELGRGVTRRLTEGEYELSSVTELVGQGALLARANRDHPGRHEVLRIALFDGASTAVTELGGRTEYVLDPTQQRLALRSSRTLTPEELFLKDLAAPVPARQLTFSTEPAFEAVQWIEPSHVEVPSRHGRPIHARLYTPPASAPEAADAGRPAVLFVHGAGYLQNAHFGWSGYFREFFFHDLLARSGVVVLDMDYRASAGYGRDWRAAIHLVMGEPELEDFEDGVAFLAARHGVDPARIGIYGGSYGGFMTLMAMFKRPGLFQAGAALRSVTDWAHYNDGYTRNILETPELAPESYRNSSPIEWAEGLEGALLMCHGMLDDNVLAKDSVRLAQRLIELEKDDWELSLYPLEPHGFREPSSWRDEYSRILSLFERELGFEALNR